jgi:hypothetical protein
VKTAVAVPLLLLARLAYGQCTLQSCTYSVPDSWVSGMPVEFSATCSELSSLTWSFGDGSSATGTSVTHTYTAPNHDAFGNPTFYRWTFQVTTASATCEYSSYIDIVESSAQQCSFCAVLVPTAGDVHRYVPFAPFCPQVASYTWSYGDGSSDTGPSPYCPTCPISYSYSQPGVYNWTAQMVSRNGDTCESAGRITVSGCKVVSLSIDTNRQVALGSVNLQWVTNGMPDCAPGGDVKDVRFEIDSDKTQVDSVAWTQLSRTVSLGRIAFEGVGYHVLSVWPIVCRTCSLCGGACGLVWPGYDRADNEQGITVVTDPNCAPIEITEQPVSQKVMDSPITLTVASTAADAKYDWFRMSNRHNDSSLLSDSHAATLDAYGDGFYWVDVTSPCGSSARSKLVAVCKPPLITSPPQSQTVEPGHNAVLVATAYGIQMTLHWYAGTPENPVPLSGAPSVVISGYADGLAEMTTSLDTGSLTADGSFFVEASDTCGNVVASQVATVTVQHGRRRPVRH